MCLLGFPDFNTNILYQIIINIINITDCLGVIKNMDVKHSGDSQTSAKVLILFYNSKTVQAIHCN